MATDIDVQVGAPRAWNFAGRDWQVSGLTPYQLGRLTARLKDVVPHPVEEVKKLLKDGTFTAEERKVLFDEARAAAVPRYEMQGRRAVQVGGWPPSFGSQQSSDLFFDGEGIAFFLWVVLAKHQPELTLADAEKLAPLCDVAALGALMALIRAGGDEDDDGDDEDAPGGGLPEGMADPKA
jgi:hypothetical protein